MLLKLTRMFLLTQHFHEANDLNGAVKSQANKRQRTYPPVFSRTSNTYQGESSIHLKDIDGNWHYTREKKDASKREKELGPIWRLAKEREKEIMGKDCILQISEYKQYIMDESVCMLNDTTSEYLDSSLIRQIATRPVVKDEKFLKIFLTANFGPNIRVLLTEALYTWIFTNLLLLQERSIRKNFFISWTQYCSFYPDLWIHSLWFQTIFYCAQLKGLPISGEKPLGLRQYLQNFQQFYWNLLKGAQLF